MPNEDVLTYEALPTHNSHRVASVDYGFSTTLNQSTGYGLAEMTPVGHEI